MKRMFAPIIATTALIVAGCGSTETAENSPAPETVFVTTTEKSDDERRKELEHNVNKLIPIKQVSDENMLNECGFAIGAEVPDAGNMNLPDSVEFTDLGGKDVQMFSTNFDFSYESESTGQTVEANALCTVTTKDGVIDDTSVVVI